MLLPFALSRQWLAVIQSLGTELQLQDKPNLPHLSLAVVIATVMLPATGYCYQVSILSHDKYVVKMLNSILYSVSPYSLSNAKYCLGKMTLHILVCGHRHTLSCNRLWMPVSCESFRLSIIPRPNDIHRLWRKPAHVRHGWFLAIFRFKHWATSPRFFHFVLVSMLELYSWVC